MGTQYNDMLPSGEIGGYHPSCPKCAMSDYEWSDDSDSCSSSSSEDLEEIRKKNKKAKKQNGQLSENLRNCKTSTRISDTMCFKLRA